MTHRVLWFDPIFGASGDMILASLVGLGAPIDDIAASLEQLDVDGWKITVSTVQRGSMTATRTEVTCTETDDHRRWSAIDRLLADAPLPEPVSRGARSTFRALAEAEAAIHGVGIDEVHFHEVGAIDAIVDIVGCWLALDLLAVDEIQCGPIGIGHGTVEAAHGLLPLPAPATAALLKGATLSPLDTGGETVTPTGAALLATMSQSWSPMPSGTLIDLARGAGGRDPRSHPNVVSAYLIDRSADDDPTGTIVGPAVLLQTNLDDVTGEVVGHTIARCLELGADDCWAQPIVMKKGRPGVELNVLTRAELVADLRRAVVAETGSLGVRITTLTKVALPRWFETVEVEGRPIAVKIGPHGAKPEFDDVASVARELSRPLGEVARQALDAYHRRLSTGDETGAN